MRFCRYGGFGDGRVIHIVVEYSMFIVIYHEFYGVVDCRVNCVYNYVARRQFIRFPSARVVVFCRNFGNGDVRVVRRVFYHCNGKTVCLEGYVVLTSFINCLNRLVAAVKGVRAPLTAVARLFRYGGFSNCVVFNRVRNFRNHFTVSHEGYFVFDSRVDCVYGNVARREFIRFPSNRVVFFFGCGRYGDVFVFYVVGLRRANQFTVSLEVYDVVDKGVNSFYRNVARRQFVFSPSARVTNFFRNSGYGDFFVFYRVSSRFYRCAVSHEVYRVGVNRVNSFYRNVARRQFVRFPYARITNLCRYFGYGDVFVFYRVSSRTNRYIVSREGYGVFDCRINCVNGDVFAKFIRFPCARVTVFCGYVRGENARCAFLVDDGFYGYAIRHESCRELVLAKFSRFLFYRACAFAGNRTATCIFGRFAKVAGRDCTNRCRQC